MSRIIGIDLGTTNSLVAALDSGIPVVVPDRDGRRLTPSVVHFPGGREVDPWVGEPAQRVRAVQPERTVYSIKRFMGRRGADLERDESALGFPVSAHSDGGVRVPIDEADWTPEEISAAILKKLKRDAESYFEEPVERAVITVPAYFNDTQRLATKTAGELAGFAVERILNEPTAAALAYGLDRLKETSKIAVFDLGGGTFDLSILELRDGVFQVLATSGNTRLGGDDFDRLIVSFLADRIRSEGIPDALTDPLAVARLREAAEQAKIRLSTETETEVALPFLVPGGNFRCSLSRDELEGIVKSALQKTRAHCARALADAQLEARELDQVILVGGQTRMPLVRRFVAETFECSEFDEALGEIRVGTSHPRPGGPVLNTSQHPEEAVALGAAIQAEILSGGLQHLLLLDVTPLSLGLETFGGLMNVLIPRNSTIPIKAGEAFTTAVDRQTSMLIHVLQGERERAADNWSLGRFTVEFEPAPRGVARVGVQFEIDANGILHVLARDIRTGKQKEVDLKSAVEVDDAAVQSMIEESVEHAFDDLRARQWVEAKLRAQEVRDATLKGLEQCGNRLSPADRERIQAAISSVDEALGVGGDGPKDVERLKSAVKNLDSVTQPLADLIMDQAMESALRARGVIE